jgi:hypothetical protein
MQNKEVSWLMIWLSGALGGIAMRATSMSDFLAAASAGLVSLWLSGALPTWKEIRQILRGSRESAIDPDGEAQHQS